MSALNDFLARLAPVPLAERPDVIANEAIETGGTFDPVSAIVVIDLHGVRVDHDSIHGAIAAWVRAATRQLAAEDLAWAETVLKDAGSLACERLKAARLILERSDEFALRHVAQTELARIEGRAA